MSHNVSGFLARSKKGSLGFVKSWQGMAAVWRDVSVTELDDVCHKPYALQNSFINTEIPETMSVPQSACIQCLIYTQLLQLAACLYS